MHNFTHQSLNLGSNPAFGVSEIRDGENLSQWSQLEIRLNAFCWSTIPQKQFIIIKQCLGCSLGDQPSYVKKLVKKVSTPALIIAMS